MLPDTGEILVGRYKCESFDRLLLLFDDFSKSCWLPYYYDIATGFPYKVPWAPRREEIKRPRPARCLSRKMSNKNANNAQVFSL